MSKTNKAWESCHIRNDGNGWEVSFFGGIKPSGEYRFYDAHPDAIFDTLEEAKECASQQATYVNIVEIPPRVSLVW